MQIIGFNFTKISAERKGSPQGKLNIKMGINFSKIEKEKALSLGQEVLRTEFEFNISYEKVSNFDFKGAIYITSTPEKLKEIIKKWEKEKKIPEDIKVPLYNFVLTKCNVKALQFEEEFNLPPHIPLPKIAKTSEETEKTKKAGYTG